MGKTTRNKKEKANARFEFEEPKGNKPLCQEWLNKLKEVISERQDQHDGVGFDV